MLCREINFGMRQQKVEEDLEWILCVLRGWAGSLGWGFIVAGAFAADTRVVLASLLPSEGL